MATLNLNQDDNVMVVRELEASPSARVKTFKQAEQQRKSTTGITHSLYSTPVEIQPTSRLVSYSAPVKQSLPQEVEPARLNVERLTVEASPSEVRKLTQYVSNIPKLEFKNKKSLEEQAKVLSLDWSSDSQHLLMSLQNGSVNIWDTFLKQRTQTIKTPCTWVFTAAFSPSQSLIAAGGLDSKCDVYKLPRGKQNNAEVQHVALHQSYVLSCAFTTSDHQILTASSDTTCALWDVESSTMMKDFKGHTLDVTSIDFSKNTGSCFATGSADRNVALWDMRAGFCVQSFRTHTDEVNQVKFFPNCEAIASVSDDLTCRLYELRMSRQLAVYKRNSILFPACSLDFSLNGRLLFVGYGDHSFHVWDTLKNVHCCSIHGHENKVNAIKVSPDGSTIATGSWDQYVRLWSI